MQATIIEQSKGAARIAVEVPEVEVAKAYTSIYRSLAQHVRVDGFRPGKAPRRVLEARLGKESVVSEVREAIITRFYPRAVQSLGLHPVHADVDAGEPVEGEPFRFTVAIELYPEVELADPSEIVIDSGVTTLSEAQLSEALEAIRRERATLVPVDRAIEPGDYLSVESLTDGGEATGNRMPLDLENIDSGLAEGFIGKYAGDVVELRIPHDHPLEENDDPDAHKTVLRVKVLDVKAKEKPELDDDLAATLGFGGWQEAEAHIRQNLQDRLDAQGFEEQQEEFIDKLVETSEVTLPESMVARQETVLRARLEDDLKRRGAGLDDFLGSVSDEQRSSLEADFRENAEKQVKRDLVLEKLLTARTTTLSETEFKRALEALAQGRRTTLLQLRKELGDEGLSSYRYLLLRDKAVREAVKERLKNTFQTAEVSAAKASASPRDAADQSADEPTPDASGETGLLSAATKAPEAAHAAPEHNDEESERS